MIREANERAVQLTEEELDRAMQARDRAADTVHDLPAVTTPTANSAGDDDSVVARLLLNLSRRQLLILHKSSTLPLRFAASNISVPMLPPICHPPPFLTIVASTMNIEYLVSMSPLYP